MGQGENQATGQGYKVGYSHSPTLQSTTNLEVAHRWAWWLHNPYHKGAPNASEHERKSPVAHNCAWWLHNPCCLGGSPTLQTEGQNQKWPTSGLGGCIAPAV